MKHMVRLRKMLNIATKLEWISGNGYNRYAVSYTKVDRGHLTEQELQTILSKEIEIKRLDYVRDLFIFSCYTGLAYIDVCQLTPENVILNIDGELWIHTKRQKTGVTVKVPLLPAAQSIVYKYKDDPKSLYKNRLFPVISNQKLNSYLKEIADICGISKNLTFHLARHTFATTVTLANRVPIETVSKLLGRTKLSTTQIYAKVLQQKISKDMMALRHKLDS